MKLKKTDKEKTNGVINFARVYQQMDVVENMASHLNWVGNRQKKREGKRPFSYLTNHTAGQKLWGKCGAILKFRKGKYLLSDFSKKSVYKSFDCNGAALRYYKQKPNLKESQCCLV